MFLIYSRFYIKVPCCWLRLQYVKTSWHLCISFKRSEFKYKYNVSKLSCNNLDKQQLLHIWYQDAIIKKETFSW